MAKRKKENWQPSPREERQYVLENQLWGVVRQLMVVDAKNVVENLRFLAHVAELELARKKRRAGR